ncbi:hypothetical protein HRI_001395100 [Hibiscus trionum]|uniref:Endonuclease/exonuclease/phosphatase domain-containing protein n=1 Tax=Hibiscus trionum TaxID=183268 RepID=A0A9W7HI22_HIBTR|nr:hypothetical protein HRI_001395100 [Hibiscus trionum]
MNFSILSWNVRGLGKKEKARAVRRLVGSKKPTVFFLQETKLSKFDPSMYRRLGCGNLMESIAVPAIGSSGGLFCAWNSEVFEVSDKFVFNRFTAIIGRFK